ncbi:MAG: S-layer homology domain-containing protein [Candidatus Atribacteria bacterium]|nr:S-layer homology domain-containing protein [Candidatus Atribacteria bacterium]MCD6350080.1 S-layer homology domain-containing protein [Candidatus Atribacteria bacterium]
MKKLALALVLVLAFALPALANPFVDVPLNHWAYDAVQSLAAKGVIIGYPDGTFGGNRALTRYEFAQAIARALGYMEQYVDEAGFASQDDVAMLEKLVQEFADELKSLGVTVDDLKKALGENSQAIKALEDRVSNLEEYAEPVKVTGEFDVVYTAYAPTDAGAGKTDVSLSDETTLTIAADINEYTTAGVELIIDDTFSAPVVSADNFYIEYQKDEWYLKAGDIDLAKFGLGLVLGEYQPDDDDNDLSFEGFNVVYTPEDSDIVWKLVGAPNDWYTLRAEWEQVGLGVTLIPESTMIFDATSDLIVSADAWTDFDEEDVKLTVEGAYGVLSGSYAAAGELWFKASDDVDFTVDAHYVTAGFTPASSTASPSSFNDDEMGFGIAANFNLSGDEDEDQWTLAAEYDWAQQISTGTVTTNDIGATLTYVPSDAVENEQFVLDFDYSLNTASFVVFGGYEDYDLEVEDENEDAYLGALVQYDSATSQLVAVGRLTYKWLEENTTLTIEGRYDSAWTTSMPVSVYGEVEWAMADNTTLTVGYEYQTWGADEDWPDDFEIDTARGIVDTAGTITAELDVTF